ncbi:MAG: radical SAM protein, partial [Bacilli bacterium]
SIDLLTSEGFQSDIEDHVEAIKSIIKRHPMNQYEINGFLVKRKCSNADEIMMKLQNDSSVEIVSYRNYHTYRLK